jgi:hypothetical protein
MVLPPCTLTISMAIPGLPFTRAVDSCSCWVSSTRASCSSLIGTPPRRATTSWPNSAGLTMRPLICTTLSDSARLTVPAGKSWFSLRTALTTSLTLMPNACSFSTSRYTLIWRLRPPTTVTRPTPLTVCSRFTISCSARVVSSRRSTRSDDRPSEITGASSGSMREITGSLISLRKPERTAATFSRTSCTATSGLISS